jgi:hypothetical protein
MEYILRIDTRSLNKFEQPLSRHEFSRAHTERNGFTPALIARRVNPEPAIRWCLRIPLAAISRLVYTLPFCPLLLDRW